MGGGAEDCKIDGENGANWLIGARGRGPVLAQRVRERVLSRRQDQYYGLLVEQVLIDALWMHVACDLSPLCLPEKEGER